MKIKIALPLSSLLTALILAGCGSGSTSQPATPPQAPQGVISYAGIYSMFTLPPAKQSTLSTNSASNNCGSIMGKSGAGFNAATGFLSMIPEVGAALGAVTGATGSVLTLMGSNSANNCVTNEFNNIENQLVVQQAEINQITTNLALTNNNIWTAMAGTDDVIQNIAYTNFIDEINQFSDNTGLFIEAYTSAGLYNSNSLSLTNVTITQLAESTTLLTNLSAKLNGENNLSETLSEITGTNINTMSCNSMNLNSCYNNVVASTSTYYVTLLSATNNNLETQLINGLIGGENITPILDNYNNTLVAYFQQSTYAIQEAYHLAYLANYLNYNQTNATAATTMPDMFGLAGTYFAPNGTLAQYNQAQQNLTLMFGAIVNQMYQNTLGYMVTDVPTTAQAYPNTQQIPYYNESGILQYGESINYTKFIGAALPSTARTASQVLYQALNQFSGTNNSSYVALTGNLNTVSIINYQYGGIHNVATCVGSLETYNNTYGTTGYESQAFATAAACPSLLTDVNSNWVNQGVIESNTVQPYYKASNNLPVLSGDVTNNTNLIACNPNPVGTSTVVGYLPAFNMYWYTPVSGKPSLGVVGTSYLMCGNFQTSHLTSNQGSGYATNAIPGNYGINGQYFPQGNFAGMLWSTYDTNAYTELTFNGHPTTLTQQDELAVWSSGSSYSALSVGTQYSGIYSEYVNDNWGSGYNGSQMIHVVAVQTTQPDGFIAPYGVTIGNTYSSSTYTAVLEQIGIPQSSGYSVGIAPNPNVIQANVTINGQPIYDLANISLNGTQYTSIANMVNNYQWTPVTSILPELLNSAAGGGIGGAVSALGINNSLMSTVGTITSGNASINICAAAYGNISASGFSYGFNRFATHTLGNGVVASFGMNCY